MKFLIFIVFILNINNASAWTIFGPRSLEDCILENMKGVTSDDAALQIRVACMQKFPGDEPKKCKMREMTAAEANNVTGNASISSTPYFSGSFYNGNSVATVDEIVVIFRADNIKPPQEYKLYLSYPIAPKSSNTAGITVQLAPTKNFEWNFRSLKTCTR
jgi:hypothetical protein